MPTERLTNGIKMTTAHDWIRLDLGNNRGLTTSYSGVKANGSVPVGVFHAWDKASQPGAGIVDRIVEFATITLPTLWPDWDKAPDTSHFQIGTRVSTTYGKNTRLATIYQLPKRPGQYFIIRYDGAGLFKVAADVLELA